MAAGTGRVAIPFAAAGYRVVALDRSAAMLDVLRSKATGQTISEVAGPGAPLPFRNGAFDAVVIARLLYLTPDWQRILVEGLRVLAPVGCLLHEWANGSPGEPSVRIKEHLRMLLEAAGITDPFHPGVRRESDVDAFLLERGCTLVEEVTVPLDGGMSVEDFLNKIEAGEFSYTWKASDPIKAECVAALRAWTAERFDLSTQVFASSTSWKVFASPAR